MVFSDYLRVALECAVADSEAGDDGGELKEFRQLCRRGVRQNWMRVKAIPFVKSYLWCVGSTRKPYERHCRYIKRQERLFRQCDPKNIVNARTDIRKDWRSRKDGQCHKEDLKREMLESVIEAARRICAKGWDEFKQEYLLLPDDPRSENADDWQKAYWQLRSFPEVGDAISWYLIRNLYGAPFLKPDIHIREIAKHFFAGTARPVDAMTVEVRKCWPKVCKYRRFRPLHLGEVDYVLWWYKRKNALDEG